MSKKLLEAWRQRDLEAFQVVLREEVIALNYLYPEEGYCSILESIASTVSPESKDFALALISSGASVDLMNPMSGKAPLHLATEALNRPILEALLAANADVNTKDLTGCGVLHLLAYKAPPKLDKVHEQCLDLILSRPDLYLNHENKKGLTPVLTAYEQGAWRVLMKLLRAGAFISDIDYEVEGKKSLREEIQERCPELLAELPVADFCEPKPSSTPRADVNHLISLLESSTEDRFCHTFNIYMADMTRRDSISTKSDVQRLLQRAVQKGHTKPINTLLQFITNSEFADEKADITREALFTACQAGKSEMVKRILEEDPNLSPDKDGKTALHILASVEKFSEDHTACWKLLDKKIDVNLSDNNGNTALHMATSAPAAEVILNSGANMFLKNKTGVPAFEKIPISTIEHFLDSNIEIQKEAREFYFDLEFMNPNRVFNKTEKDESPLLGGTVSKNLPEVKQLLLLSESKSSKLLSHPIFQVFIAYKWKLIKPLFYFQMLTSAIFNMSLLIYVDNSTRPIEDQSPILLVFLKTLLLISLVVRYTEYLIRAIASPHKVFAHVHEIHDFLVTLLTTAIIALGFHSSLHQLYLTIASKTIILAGICIFHQLASHPNFALKFSIAWTLLKTCAIIIAIYLINLISFAMAFSIMSRASHVLERPTIFFGGFTFEVPFIWSGQGYQIERNSRLSFLMFIILLLTALVHLISAGITVRNIILESSDFYIMKAQVDLIAEKEELFITTPRAWLKKINNHTTLNILAPNFLKKIAERILLFPKNGARLRLPMNENNILTTFQSGNKKSSWWDKPVYISHELVAQLNQIIETRSALDPIPNKHDLFVSNLTEKTNLILDRIRQTSIVLEKLENRTKEMENLLIQSLRINGLRDQNL